MKAVVVGDLHLKQSRVLPLIDAALERTGADRVVLCGDYTDDWGASDDDQLGELAQLVAWIGGRRRAGVRVDTLMGNHDFAYLTGNGNSGTRRWLIPEVRRLLGDIDIVMATCVDDILVTHAGVTGRWAEHRLGLPAEGDDTPVTAGQVRDKLNAWLADEDRTHWNELDEVGRARGGWGLPGPLWADASELVADPLPGLRQIVGHTPMPTCTCLTDDEGVPGREEIWACDTFSTYRNGTPIGDASLLLVDDEPAGASDGPAPRISVLPTGLAPVDVS